MTLKHFFSILVIWSIEFVKQILPEGHFVTSWSKVCCLVFDFFLRFHLSQIRLSRFVIPGCCKLMLFKDTSSLFTASFT